MRSKKEMHVWRAKFDMMHAMFHNIYAMFYLFMPWFIYLCHYLHIYAMFYIFMPNFKYLCHVFYIYVNFNTCCITIHLRCIKISIFVVLSSLIYIVSPKIYVASTQQIYVVWRFVSTQQFHFFHYPIQWEVIITCSSLCGPTYPIGFEITRYNSSQ